MFIEIDEKYRVV